MIQKIIQILNNQLKNCKNQILKFNKNNKKIKKNR